MKKAIQIQYNNMFEDKCKYASLAGFEHIAVNFDETSERINRSVKNASEDIIRILGENNLIAVQTHLPCYDLRISAEEIDNKTEKTIINAIKISGAIGAEWCVYHPRTAITDGYVSEKSMCINQKTILGYIDEAVKSNTNIAVENIPIFGNMPFFSCDFGELSLLTDSFKSDCVGICWDTGHANLMPFDQGKAIEYLGDRIKCTHIHNNWQVRDDHNAPDNGNIKWDKVMKAFKTINYEGPLTLETHCWYSDYPEMLKSFAKHNYECLNYLERLMK